MVYDLLLPRDHKCSALWFVSFLHLDTLRAL